VGAAAGFTAIELLFSMAVAGAVLAVALPLTHSALDDLRTGMAARYLAGRIVGARVDAVQRSTRVALRFEDAGGELGFALYMDGNANGVRTADVLSGIDPLLTARQRLRDRFPGVSFGLDAAVPDLDGQVRQVMDDGVGVGNARLLTLGPDGTATSGTLYLRGRQARFAVRVLGATARVRVFKYQAGARVWRVQ
jgi:type II secretory pathway pseudopilin PulG